jgi:hypothetical protein
MVEEPSPQYTISISQAELDKLRQWAAWAKEKGVLDDYLVALKTINFRLAFEPTEWGEFRYPLDDLKLDIRLGSFKMLDVKYGVHREQRIVFVKQFQFRSDYPHGQPPETA